jgi:hypothetical protein
MACARSTAARVCSLVEVFMPLAAGCLAPVHYTGYAVLYITFITVFHHEDKGVVEKSVTRCWATCTWPQDVCLCMLLLSMVWCNSANMALLPAAPAALAAILGCTQPHCSRHSFDLSLWRSSLLTASARIKWDSNTCPTAHCSA